MGSAVWKAERNKAEVSFKQHSLETHRQANQSPVTRTIWLSSSTK